MKWFPAECKKGDLIRVKAGSLYHYGIFVSEDEIIQFGGRPERLFNGGFIGDQSQVKVLVSGIAEFSAGNIVEVGVPEKSEAKKMRKPGEIIECARSHIGEGGYDIIHNNCEHFVNFCAFGERRSDTVERIKEGFKKRGICKVYFAETAKECGEALYPEERQREIDCAADLKVKAEKYSVWELLGRALMHAFGEDINSIKFKKSADGRWSCREYCFSLAHSNGVVCVALSTSPVGVDIEGKREFFDKFQGERAQALQRKISAKGELCKAASPEELIKIWTEKESLFKLRGKGKFNPQKIKSGAEKVCFYELDFGGGYTCCVCGELSDRAEYFFCNGEGTVRRLN